MPRADEWDLAKPAPKKNLRTRLHRNHGLDCNLTGDVAPFSAGIKTRGSVRASLSASPALLQLSITVKGSL